MRRRLILFYPLNLTSVVLEEVLLECGLVHSSSIDVIVLPDVQLISDEVLVPAVEDDSFDRKWSPANNAIVDRHVNNALGPVIVLPVGAHEGVRSLLSQRSIQIVEDAFMRPPPPDSILNVCKFKL